VRTTQVLQFADFRFSVAFGAKLPTLSAVRVLLKSMLAFWRETTASVAFRGGRPGPELCMFPDTPAAQEVDSQYTPALWQNCGEQVAG
jgi:hypothetical protein